MRLAFTDRITVRAIEAFQKTGRKAQPTFQLSAGEPSLSSGRNDQHQRCPIYHDQAPCARILRCRTSAANSPDFSQAVFPLCSFSKHNDAQHTDTSPSICTNKRLTHSSSASSHRSHFPISAATARMHAPLRRNVRTSCPEPDVQPEPARQTKGIGSPGRLR